MSTELRFETVRIPLASKATGGITEVPVLGEYVAPGLVITPLMGGDDEGRAFYVGGWVVSHTASGMSLNGTSQILVCMGCIERYAEAAKATGWDWTLPQPDLTDLINSGGDVVETFLEARNEALRCGGTECQGFGDE